ncbi:MAG: hypothetical protein VX704_01650, partial [Verrucomicrobiota bacterium]|nr:hypothetical protein [Verrucomicrobiota bacterium]
LVKRLVKRHNDWQAEMRRSAVEYGLAKSKQKAASVKPSARELKRDQKRAERRKARQKTKQSK